MSEKIQFEELEMIWKEEGYDNVVCSLNEICLECRNMLLDQFGGWYYERDLSEEENDLVVVIMPLVRVNGEREISLRIILA